MVNLLFISNSPRCALLRNALQPQLKVIIDIVADFDHGLKDVFEKRPSVVCIQDHIDGVTGESVARHIQMLLGTGAPTFILLHEGNAKAKQLKGLFEQVIDLGQPDDKMADDVLSFLKTTLGPQWDKVYIPPKQNRRAALAKVAVPDGERHVADKMVDDFLSDLEGAPADKVEPARSNVHDFSSSHADEDTPFHVTSSADEMAAMLAEVAAKTAQEEEKAGAVESAVAPEQPASAANRKPAVLTAEPVESAPPKGRPARRKPAAKEALEDHPSVAPPVPDVPAAVARAAEMAAEPPSAAEPAPLTVEQALAAEERSRHELQQPGPAPATDFRITPQPEPKAQAAGEHIPDDLLLAFEENYRSQNSSRTRAAAVVITVLVALGAVGWYLARFKSAPVTVAKYVPTVSVVPRTPASAPPAATPAVPPARVAQKPLSSSQTRTASGSALPSFVPAAGIDKAFSAGKPGWERYVGARAEYRIYRTGERIKAIQVLDVKHQGLSKTLLKSVLGELVGSTEYRETGSERKQGYQVVRGAVGSKAELVVYSKNSKLRAFVVSLN